MMIELDHFDLNASIKLTDEEGSLQLFKDKEALKSYFLNDVNQNTVFFHSLEEKIEYLLNEEYYEKEIIERYSFDFIKKLFKLAYSKQFRFKSFVGAYKYYQSYTLKTFDGKRFLERYEDRVCMNALYLACGNEKLAISILEEIISNRFQPATPTFLNTGKNSRGELVSCYLLKISDNMNSISRSINAALQLSKRGGGVAFSLTDIRETGAPIKKVKGQSSGIIPIMKLFEDSFSYANQLGARSGAGAVYLNAHHPEIMEFLDTKRENADEKVRIKTLSLGVVIPDITFELAKKNEDMYLFSPYDVQRVYGVPLSELSITEKYHEMVENPEITKRKISARVFFQTIAELQFESGYPYIMFEDTVNEANPIDGRVVLSNLCVAPNTKILTDEGYREIQDLENTIQTIWNGEEWSNVPVVKTGVNQKLLRVEFDSSQPLDCTPYHRFLVQRVNKSNKITEPEIVEAKDLVEGDRLARWELPLIEGNDTLNKAYTNGFYSADGCEIMQERYVNASSRIYLYGDKRDLKEHIEFDGTWLDTNESRLVASNVPGLKPKFFVPDASYTIESRLKWFAGYCDGDGTMAKTNIQVSSVNLDFLHEVQLMLQTLGVHSKVKLAREEGMLDMPANDGTGNNKSYHCKAIHRLLISSKNVEQLINIGFKPNRLKMPAFKQSVATNERYVRVSSVTEIEGLHDTYCFQEDKRSMGMFNGICSMNCSEILQTSEDSEYNEDLSYSKVGKDISCNLGSMNVALAMESPDFGKTVDAAIRSLTAVSDLSNISSVPSIEKGNADTHAIGLGQMNLHGFFCKEHMYYGSEESIDFTDMYFYTVAYHAYKASCAIAKERKQWFKGFEKSQYANGEYFKKYTDEVNVPKTKKVQKIFEKYGIEIPTQEDWVKLAKDVKKYGLYNAYLQAVPPTGSISYINNSTASIHPIIDKVEVRKEGKLGRVYYPAPHMNSDNMKYYESAYDVGYEKIIDVYAAATKHVDQGLSLTLFFKDTATTRDINKAQIYAWKKGIKTLYYIRIKQDALDGVDDAIEECESCKL